MNTSPQPLALTFSWNLIGFDSDDRVRLEIAEDRAFTTILRRYESRGKTRSVALENGHYYWRAYPAGQNSLEGGVSGRLSLVDASPPELINPAPEEEFTFRTTRPGIRFLWTSREGAETYHIEISTGPNISFWNFPCRGHVPVPHTEL